jgi:hypothetical protein
MNSDLFASVADASRHAEVALGWAPIEAHSLRSHHNTSLTYHAQADTYSAGGGSSHRSSNPSSVHAAPAISEQKRQEILERNKLISATSSQHSGSSYWNALQHTPQWPSTGSAAGGSSAGHFSETGAVSPAAAYPAQRSAAAAVAAAMPAAASVSAAHGRYNNREQREQLALRLLQEREDRLYSAAAGGSDDAYASSDDEPNIVYPGDYSNGDADLYSAAPPYYTDENSVPRADRSTATAGARSRTVGASPAARSARSAKPTGSQQEQQQQQRSSSKVRPRTAELAQPRQAAAAAAPDAECSFRPTITDYAETKRVKAAGSSGPERISQLARGQTAVYKARAAAQAAQRQAAEARECTFAPRTNANTAATAAASGSAGSSSGAAAKHAQQRNHNQQQQQQQQQLPVHERLLAGQKERAVQLAAAAAQLEAATLKECSFQPHLVASPRKQSATAAAAAGAGAGSDSPQRPPLHERVWEVQREKEHRLRALEAERAEREGYSFTPAIPHSSARLAHYARPPPPPLPQPAEQPEQQQQQYAYAQPRQLKPQQQQPREHVSERLAREAAAARERRAAAAAAAEAEEAAHSTFEPQLSAGTRRLVAQRAELQAPFSERQALLDARSRAREQQRVAAAAAAEAAWFQPSTAPRSQVLAARRRGGSEAAAETPEQMGVRMALVEVSASVMCYTSVANTLMLE